MNRLLFVDDDRLFLRGVSAWFRGRGGFEVLTATDGAEAIDLLRTKKVDLVVTDLRMPVVDGFELLAHMSRNRPETPVMVITADATFSVRERIRRLGTLTCLEKPLPMEELLAEVERTLEGGARGFLQGISVTSILQLLEMERKTAEVTVHDGDREGRLAFVEGELVHARTSDHEGDEAAMRIIAWEAARATFDPTDAEPRKTVTSNLQHLMMEALRRKDEGSLEESLREPPPETPLPRRTDHPPAPLSQKGVEELLEALGEVTGVRAAAVLGPTKELVAVRSWDDEVDLNSGESALISLGAAAGAASASIGAGGWSETTVGTSRGLLVVQSPQMEGAVEIWLVALLAWDCDQGAFAAKLVEHLPRVWQSA